MSDQTELSSPATSLSNKTYAALLALADDELVIGHRHSEWLGLSPFLEEDLTLSSIAQDEFGHARALYALIWPDWSSRDADITRRPAEQWRSCALTELDGRPWELSLARHFLYDIAEPFRWDGIAETFATSVPGLAELATTVVAEERFHARHATDLMTRLAQDPHGRARINAQLLVLRPLSDGLATGMTETGWGRFTTAVDDLLDSAGLATLFNSQALPAPVDRTVRSGDFASIHAQLLEVFRFDPSATW
jgi:ring-1,2-phenylacetyl-CoA epoxidase subunit PaaC